MRNIISSTLWVAFCLPLLVAIPEAAFAIPAITCHCFTDRSYDPARPTLADPYFLASTQNSFLAAVFSVDKKEIVVKKQTGTASDDLWIAYWIASNGRSLTPDAVLRAYQGKKNWPDTISVLGIPTKNLGARFSSALKSNPSSGRLSDAIVDELLIRYRMQNETELAALRKEHGTNQEIILASFIAIKSRQPASLLLQDVKRGSRSWGAVLDSIKLGPHEIQNEMSALVKRSSS